MAVDQAPQGPPKLSLVRRIFWPFDPASHWVPSPGEQNHARAIYHISERVEREDSKFKWRIFFVAGLGFLTDSYNLFAPNVILPALSYLYWGSKSKTYAQAFNLVTLIGSIIGQISFGVLVDIYGRRSLYGFELMIVVISTLGLLQSSVGLNINSTFDAYGSISEQGLQTWSITAWLFIWRIVMGIGIGAEYPLSACIAAEWSSKHHRARMMSAVFLMQPLGQLLAYAVGMITIKSLDFQDDMPDPLRRIKVDIFWRVVIVVGAAPTLLALLARRLIPESWRFTYFVAKNPGKASFDSGDVYPDDDLNQTNHTNGHSEYSHSGRDSFMDGQPGLPQAPHRASLASVAGSVPPQLLPAWKPGSQFHWPKLKAYLWEIRTVLAGTSLTWLLLDVAFYGMGFGSPGTLAKLWTTDNIDYRSSEPWWQSNSDLDMSRVEHVLYNTMWHAVCTTSIAAMAGSVLFVILAPILNRRIMLISTFFVLSILLAITAAAFPWLFQGAHPEDKSADRKPLGNGWWVLVVLWALIQFVFSFGPNTLTFIIPAEVFPTRYRCTSYGIAAASGKLGAVIIVAIQWHLSPKDPNTTSQLVWLLGTFSVCMAVGGLISLSPKAIPHVQDGLKTLSLEELCDDGRYLDLPTPRHLKA